MGWASRERITGLVVGLAFSGLVLSSWLTWLEISSGSVCPEVLGVPACYLVMFGYAAVVSGAWKSEPTGVGAAFLGAALVAGVGGYLSVLELSGQEVCPRFAGLPMCFVSAAAGVLLLAGLARRSTLGGRDAAGSHSLYQVSTSSALVRGVFGGTVTVRDLLEHGDFGLGTFAGLDGEMIVTEGQCYRITAMGRVSVAEPHREVPFALITTFSPDIRSEIGEADLDAMLAHVDTLRSSENLFVGIRAHGTFHQLTMRAICRAEPGETLLQATEHQSKFEVASVEGTLVGFWTPEHAQSLGIPGYHLHFVSGDRTVGGHVLGLKAAGLAIDLHTESDLHIAFPETEEFMRANLGGDHRRELDAAERGS